MFDAAIDAGAAALLVLTVWLVLLVGGAYVVRALWRHFIGPAD